MLGTGTSGWLQERTLLVFLLMPPCAALSCCPAAAVRAYARIWYSDAPGSSWIPDGCQGVFNSFGREKSWARTCRGTCSADETCVLSSEELDSCFEC